MIRLQGNLKLVIPRALTIAAFVAVMAAMTQVAAQMAQAQTYTVLYSFTGKADGSGPDSPLLRNSIGDLFGTTASGVLFKITGGRETSLAAIGGGPEGQVSRDGEGNFYGTTNLGGSSNSGSIYTAYKTGGETVLFGFHQYVGQMPVGGVTIDSAGNLYGTTGSGGAATTGTCACGVVFEFARGGAYKVLHRFEGAQDGQDPASSLLRDSLGNLFGTTAEGGGCLLLSQGCGTVFKVSVTGVETVLHRFAGSPDGLGPLGGLIRDSAGNFYGTTTSGGTGAACTDGCGTVFAMSASGEMTILYNFQGGPGDGAVPVGRLVRDAAGNLYGVTTWGGNSPSCSTVGIGSGCGTVFKVDGSGHETILHTFEAYPSDGALPAWGLISDSNGNLYGVTQRGGANDDGTIFKIAP
jgi:uncharacterized repeat protein (TIGR03803 family)